MFDKVIGLEKITQHLTQAITNHRLASAYLFIGKQGRGKSFLASQFAKILLCTQKIACGECLSCRFFEKFTHPDFFILKKKKNFLEIMQIQELAAEIIFPPEKSKYRVVFLKEVENMNHESVNAFLKILEEPPNFCLFILSTINAQILPETITSRCQKIFFSEVSQGEIEKIVLRTSGLNKEAVSWSFRFHTSGIQKDWFLDIQKYFVARKNIWQLLSSASNTDFTELLIFGEQQEKGEVFQACFFFFTAFFYDLWLYSLAPQGGAQQLFFYSPDLQELTKQAKNKYNKEKIYGLFQKALKIENSIKHFANKSLAWSNLVIQAKTIVQ